MSREEALRAAWVAGDKTAGETLFRMHFDLVCRFFRRRVGDDVEDLIQATFLACCEARPKFRNESTFRAYLLGIARIVLLGELRRRGRRAAPDSIHSSLLDPRTPLSQGVGKQQRRRRVVEAMAQLPTDMRVVLELTYGEELSGPEVAHVLRVEANTVRSRLGRARKALREHLEPAEVTG